MPPQADRSSPTGKDADDASLAAFLEAEARKPSLASYRTYVSRVLLLAAHALEEQWPAPQVEAELDYAFAILQDAVAPADPAEFRDQLCGIVAEILTNEPCKDLRESVEAILLAPKVRAPFPP